ncbi:MAG: glycosyltransferase family 2 protein [Desulfovibrio sp.]|uniref:glycosyltransferase family 2 protein n=1 Tax=Desulfovibrio sp. 7SRBS1 TaxID=3378064 RepID=UPI003B3FA9BC
MKQRITGLILTFNGERLLERTLESLDFCDEILVVDSGSTDRTLDIARSFNAKILHRDWEGTIPQFKFAFKHVETPWVITLDQDEYLSSDLKEAVIDKLASPGDACGFHLRRRSFYFDRFLKHSGWYPDYLLRIFRMDGFELRGILPHEEFHPTGPAPKIPYDIIHYPYVDLSDQLAKISSYTKATAIHLHAQGKRGGLMQGISRAMGRFIKRYFFKLGILDGKAGFILAICDMMYVFQKYLLVAEMHEQQKHKRP